MLLSVFVEKSPVVEVVSVLWYHLHLLEANGFLDDGSVQDGVVECGVCEGSLGVFCGKCLMVGVFHCDKNCDPMVVVTMLMPVPDSQFTLGDGVEHELFKFGLSVVFPGGDAILG